MKFDTSIGFNTTLRDVPAMARAAEELGFDGLWSHETQHDPFLPLALAAEHTDRIHLGTSVAIAFARSPTAVAHAAWDLARLSGGRFLLGLGTQVKAHIEKRFGMPWAPPVARLREFILAVRALWDCWQNKTRLNFRGEHYQLTLMSPFFNPGPIEFPKIPIYTAGVGAPLCSLAGEMADGFLVHPFHSPRYLAEVVRPAVERGASKTGRSSGEVTIAVTVFVASDDAEQEALRSQVAFYASTPSYRPVLDLHSWGGVGEQLSALAHRGQWNEMPSLISDAMMEAFAVRAGSEEVAERVRQRYAGLADRLAFYRSYEPGVRDPYWTAAAKQIRSSS